MPNTSFEEVRDFIRAAVLDMDETNLIYTDNALDSQIRWELNLRQSSPYGNNDKCNLLAEGDRSYFTSILTPIQKSILSLRCAIRLISSKPEDFSYKTPVMSIARKGQTRELLEDLRRSLADVEGGRFAVASDTDFSALIQSYNRFVNDLDTGLQAWPGTTPNGQL
jgi:hypothetical protein